jgi:hypothetical protein
MSIVALQRVWDACERLRLEPQGDPWKFTAVCPAVATHGRSLTVILGADDRAVVHAEGCRCHDENVVRSLGLTRRDLLAEEPKQTVVNGKKPAADEQKSDEGLAVLRALLGALRVDVRAATLDPLGSLPGLPFMLPGSTALLAAPEGAGKSQLAQVAAYDVALAGGRVLYVAGEVTLAEFTTRGRRISEARDDGELTDAAVALWHERIAYVDIYDVLPVISRHAAAWPIVCADFDLIVLDAVSDAGAALGLKFARDNDDWNAFFQGFVQPCQGRVALLMLDNIGHAEDAHDRALGASAKGHKVDIRLWGKRREEPLSLVITCAKVRHTNAPFERGARWVAYPDAYTAASAYDGEQVELEGGETLDPVAVVVDALERSSPQSQIRLVRALRDAGVKGRDTNLRAAIKAMAVDPGVPVRAAGGKGFEFDPDVPGPKAWSQGVVHAPPTGALRMDPGSGPENGQLLDRTGGRDFTGWTAPAGRADDESDPERKDLA